MNHYRIMKELKNILFGDFTAISDIVDLPTAVILSRSVSDGIIAPGYTRPDRLASEEKAAWFSNLSGVSLGSDAFFPFTDNIDRPFQSGVKYFVKPGGSLRDDIVMAFSNIRLFHH